MVIPNWEFYGTTMVTSQYVRLTPDVQSTLGGLYNKMVNIIKIISLNITIHFLVAS